MLMSDLVRDMGNLPKMYLVNSIVLGVDSILSKRAEINQMKLLLLTQFLSQQLGYVLM